MNVSFTENAWEDYLSLEQYVDHQGIGLVLVFFECVECLFCTDAADEIFSWNFENAWEDYLYWQKMDKKIVKRINELIKITLL